jgi:hypothetical protein
MLKIVTPNGKSTTLETSKVVRNQSKTISRVTITTTSTSIININTITRSPKIILTKNSHFLSFAQLR